MGDTIEVLVLGPAQFTVGGTPLIVERPLGRAAAAMLRVVEEPPLICPA